MGNTFYGQFYTFIIVPYKSSRLHKIKVPVPAIHALWALALVAVIVTLVLGFNYVKMAIKVADYNHLQTENVTLKVANKNLEFSTRQLSGKLATLETLSARISQLISEEQTPSRRRRSPNEGPGGIGGSSVNVPTSSFLKSPDATAHVEVLKDRTNALESELRFMEQLAERRAERLRFTPTVWPVYGSIRSHFGQRMDPFTGEGEFHLGIDISGIYGTPVRAPADGKIVFAARQAAYGNVVIIEHANGLTTRLGHLSRFAARDGKNVQKGDVVGYVGTTGRTTGPHVHYEVRLNDRPVNPRPYLQRVAGN